MKIEKRFLKLPVCRYAQKKRLLFYENGKLIYDMMAQLAPEQPDDYYYPDLRLLLGKEITLVIEPDIHFTPEFTDSVPTEGIYTEKYRPNAHFTASRGWINDPNGLVWYEGQYHLFFQHNASGPLWDNMQWGHAISSDLLHWKELEVALFPDEFGSMFSGSAIVDERNLTGLKENEHDVILLYYTASPSDMALSRHNQTSQCMAYSTDGGFTFRKYPNNPILPHIIGGNRDPKVIWCEEENCYLMVLFLDENDYGLFVSNDLLHWEQTQIITIPNEAECPDLYPLISDRGNRYWVMSGASDYYLIGRINDRKFESLSKPRRLHHSLMSYAAQTYSNIPDGRRIRMAWNRAEAPESVFNGSMCTPTEMTLHETENGIYLCQQPIREFNSLLQPSISLRRDNHYPLETVASDIRINFETGSLTGFTLLGLDVTVDAAEDILLIKNYRIPLYSKDCVADLRIITDTTAIEFYTTDGKAFGCIEHIADRSLMRMTVSDTAGIRRWTAAPLANIWEKNA